jgi:hypothetical protein
MTNEEIRKLLGGYATNTLTDAERKVLFEAALDNQELFNAMQEEQALKDLLSDPVSREQVRQALVTPAPAKQAGAWWSQWWAWGSAASAVVAAILIVTVIRWNPGKPQQQEVAATTVMKPADQPPASLTKAAPPASKPELEPARARTFRKSPPPVAPRQRKDEVALAKPTPPPPPSPTQDRESTSAQPAASAGVPGSQNAGHSQNSQIPQNASTQNSVSVQAPARQEVQVSSTAQQVQVSQAANGFRDASGRGASTYQLGPGLAGALTGPLRFSMMKRDPNGAFVAIPPTNPDLKKGDVVQLRVVPVLSGYVSLSQLDQSGTWKRVFPSSGPGIPVVANNPYNLPAAPIEVTDKDERFRVTLSLATTEMKLSTSETVSVEAEKEMKSKKRARVAPLEKRAPEPSPLFVDITIGPKN